VNSRRATHVAREHQLRVVGPDALSVIPGLGVAKLIGNCFSRRGHVSVKTGRRISASIAKDAGNAWLMSSMGLVKAFSGSGASPQAEDGWNPQLSANIRTLPRRSQGKGRRATVCARTRAALPKPEVARRMCSITYSSSMRGKKRIRREQRGRESGFGLPDLLDHGTKSQALLLVHRKKF
jgi:hypothetical protein